MNFLTTPRASWHTITTEDWLFQVLSRLAFSVYIDPRRRDFYKESMFQVVPDFRSLPLHENRFLKEFYKFITFTTCGAFASYGLFGAKRRLDPFGSFLSFL